MFVSEERQITRNCKVGFEVDVRELEDDPVRSKRGINELRPPRYSTTEEGPFSFTLSHDQDKTNEQNLVILFSIARQDITGDASLDCGQYVSGIVYEREGVSEVVELLANDPSSENLRSGRDSEFIASGTMPWSTLTKLFGEEEPVNIKLSVSFTMEASFEVSAPNSTLSPLQALDNLGAFVTSPRPNDVAFILSSAPSRPLYSNKSVLSAASSYFKNHFDPLPRSRRASEAIKRTPSFVDDSDAESGDEDDDELEFLIPPELLGTQQSKRKKSVDTEEEEENYSSDVKEEKEDNGGKSEGKKRKKTGSGQNSPRKMKKVKDEGGITEIHIDDGSYSTMQAILVYLMCGQIEFAPLSSQGRDAFIREYRKKHPERPVPVSPRSVYRLATRFELKTLQARALSHLEYSFDLESAIREALSEDCFYFPDYCSLVHQQVIRNWAQVKESQIWKDVLKDAEKGRYPHSNILLPRLLLKV
ncbi:hypothetical protein JCM5350_003765 [Sporobolomyces pararoseus]